MTQKNIAIINPEDFGYDLAVLARKMGYAVIGVMVEDPERYRILRDIYCFDSDGNARAYDTLISAEHWEDAVHELRPYKPCAVISGSEIAVEYTDRIASVLGLPCNDPATIPLRRNKIEMKRAVCDAGLPYALGDTFSLFSKAAEFARSSCGYPVVVKPVCGAGSTNVSFCMNEEELAAAFARVQKTPDAYLRRSNDVLVEEYISGSEYVVNMMGTSGGVFVTDIWKYEKFSNVYSDCVYYNDIMQDVNDPQFAQLKEYAKKIYRAVGIKIGPAHAEIKLSKKGPVMIEIGSRLAGGEMPKYAAKATNVNSLEKTIDVFVNGTTSMPDSVEISAYPASADISHEKFGRLARINGLDKVRRLKTYTAEVLYAKDGDYIEPTRDVDHLAALFWFMGIDRAQVHADLEKSHRLCTVTAKNDRVLVVATTTDYVDMIRKRYPDQLVFITSPALRENAKEKKPRDSEEICCDVHDFKTALRMLRAHSEKYRQHIAGITCYDCESLMLASYIAEHLQLAFPSADAVKNCRNKMRSIDLWARSKILCPRTAEITSYEQAVSFYSKDSMPCVVKPASGSGSEMTFLCANEKELAHAWDSVMISMQAKNSDPMYLASCGGSRSVLIQEYVGGTEYSCDFIITCGKAVVLRLCRKYKYARRFGATQTYELLPESEWPETNKCLSHLFYRAAKATGRMEHAVVMVDFIETEKGLMLLEMSPRAGGDCIPPLIQKSCGVSTVNIAVEIAAGRVAKPQTLPVKQSYAACRLFAPRDGVLVSENSARIKKELPDSEVIMYRKSGDTLRLDASDYTEGLAGCVLCARTDAPEQFAAQNKKIISLFNPVITSLEDTVQSLIDSVLEKKDKYISLWKKNTCVPLRVFEPRTLSSYARKFRAAFESEFPDCGFYYAVKCNNYPGVSKIIIDEGFGLDVSSGDELDKALALGAKKIEFSGPGKTDQELEKAVEAEAEAVRRNSAGLITVLIDSFGELERLKSIAAKHKTIITAGVRILPPHGWEKFGIQLKLLKKFFDEADSCAFIKLEGIQFHTSWNMNSIQQCEALRAVALELKTWTESELARIHFIDIGGGYWPEEGEWLKGPDEQNGDLAGRVWNRSIPIAQFAAELSDVIKTEIFPLVQCQIRFEPGRWIANSCMSMLISVCDKKSDSCVITDGATNSIGWDRFQNDYFPVLNISSPSAQEHACRMYGSLCDPHDAWGFAYRGASIGRGDILLVPNQGAYTYSLQQSFIKPLPPVVETDV
jgi:diaminopimelate decarboxylase